MILSKALTALALADEVERATGVPCAPLFWAATDDADFAEARVVRIAVTGGCERLALSRAPAAGTPMAAAPLEDVGAPLARLAAACGSVADDGVLTLVRACYAAGETVGSAYVSLLRALLGRLGIAVLDAGHPAVRAAAAPLLLRAAAAAQPIADALAARATEIRAAGYEPQVEDVSGLSLVFTNAGGVKRRLSIAEAPAAAETPDADLSPNVLLRPITESAILPSVAYVGGPGEVAYFAQVSAAAAALGVTAPLIVPRWSGTIIEPRVERILHRLGVTAHAFADPHAVEGRVARSELPVGVSSALAALREHVERDLGALQADDSGLVPAASIEAARRSMLWRLERLERRYVAGVKRRHDDALQDVATARGALYPDGIRQERAIASVQMLARYGTPIVDEMLAQARAHAAAVIGVAALPATREMSPARP